MEINQKWIAYEKLNISSISTMLSIQISYAEKRIANKYTYTRPTIYPLYIISFLFVSQIQSSFAKFLHSIRFIHRVAHTRCLLTTGAHISQYSWCSVLSFFLLRVRIVVVLCIVMDFYTLNTKSLEMVI